MSKVKAYGICVYSIKKDKIKILLCKSVTSKYKWGFVKGGEEKNENPERTAIREFYEEANIKIDTQYLEKYFEQDNKNKDIGIYLVNIKNIKNKGYYFYYDTLRSKHLSLENRKIKMFNIKKLPTIKDNQSKIAKNIIDFLKNKNLSR